jgi:hypothetical protein
MIMLTWKQSQVVVSERQWEVIAAVNQQPILIRSLCDTIKVKTHRERKGQLELALNFHNFVAVFGKYLILPLNRSVSHLF